MKVSRYVMMPALLAIILIAALPASVTANQGLQGRKAVSDDVTFTTTVSSTPPPGDGGGRPAPEPTETPVVIPANFDSLPPEEAAVIIEKMTPLTAASLFEEMNTITVTTFLDKTSTAKAADIMEKLSPGKSIAIMEGLSTEKLTGIILDTSEASLLGRLPGLSVKKLHSINPQALLAALPNVPSEHLVSETPPEPPAGATAPIVVYSTPDSTRYLTIQTSAGEWAVVVGTQSPLEEVMLKTRSAARNVQTTVAILPGKPSEITAQLSEKAIASNYFEITFANVTAEDIQLGYLTFKMEKAWLDQYAINKWAIFLNRYDPELLQWVPLPTGKVAEDERYVHYTAITSRFSVFAITSYQTVPSQKFRAGNLAVSPSQAKPGETVTISADITNISNTTGTYTTSLWISGSAENATDVNLKAGETKKITFTVSRGTEGIYSVRFERLFGQFAVGSVTATPAPSASPSPSKVPVSPTPSIRPTPSVPAKTPTPTPTETTSPLSARWMLIIGIIVGCIAILAGIWYVITKRAAKTEKKAWDGAAFRTKDAIQLEAEQARQDMEAAEKALKEATLASIIKARKARETERIALAAAELAAREKTKLDAEQARKAKEAEEKTLKKAALAQKDEARFEVEQARKAKETEENAKREVVLVVNEKENFDAEQARQAKEAEEKTRKEAALAQMDEARFKAEQARKAKEDEKKAKREVALAAKEKAKLDAEQARKAKEAEIAANKSRKADEKTRRQAEEDLTRERQEQKLPAQRPARAKEAPMEKQPGPGTTLNAAGNLMIIVSNPEYSAGVALFQKSLQGVNGLQIIFIGGSDEGLLIGVSLQKPMDLLAVLNRMFIVEDAFIQGDNIVVSLKSNLLR